MANYNKSFNFRNGLQVDVDNFIITKTGLVGIGSTIPTKNLDVNGDIQVSGLTTTKTLGVLNNSEFYGDVTIGSGITFYQSTGNVHAQKYYGDGSFLSNIVGYHTEAFIVTRDPSTLIVTGIVTTAPVGLGTISANSNYDLVIGTGISFAGDSGNVYLSNVYASGIVSATSEFVGILSATYLRGTIDNDRLPSGIAISGIVTASSFKGSLTGTATTASGLSGTPNITVGIITATHVELSSSNIGFATITDTLHLDTAKIGIGTALPTADLQIHKPSGSFLEVISDEGDAKISIGNSTNIGNDSASIRYYDTNLELYNFDTGNIDIYLHRGTDAATDTTGKFRWLYGKTTTTLMSLTKDGNLGIGKTDPEHKLHVGGASTFTDAAYFSDNVTINGTLSFTESGSFTLPTVVVTNINTSSGISTFNEIESIQLETGKIGINATNPVHGLDARNDDALFSSVGIGLINPPNSLLKTLEVGAGVVDFSQAESMAIPVFDSDPTDNLQEGSLAYIGTSGSRTLKIYNGTTWVAV